MTQWNEIYRKGRGKYSYYDILRPHPDMGRVIKVFKKRGVGRVLDLGCGAGRNLWFLAKAGFSVSGIDAARSGLRIARDFLKKNKLRAELTAGDVYKRLPYPDKSFDAVVSVQVLQHSDEAGIKRAIREIERILSPGGLIFITLCGRYSLGQVRYCLVKTAKRIGNHTYIPTRGEEKGLMHFIYTKDALRRHYKNFVIKSLWKDDKDYYCFIGALKKNS